MNNSELYFRVDAESKGYTVLRTGWPDFALVRSDGSLFCVEVKSDTDSLSQEQEDMIRFLALAGIPCYISRNGEFPDLTQPIAKTDVEVDRYMQLVAGEYHHRLEHVEDFLQQIRKLCDE